MGEGIWNSKWEGSGRKMFPHLTAISFWYLKKINNPKTWSWTTGIAVILCVSKCLSEYKMLFSRPQFISHPLCSGEKALMKTHCRQWAELIVTSLEQEGNSAGQKSTGYTWEKKKFSGLGILLLCFISTGYYSIINSPCADFFCYQLTSQNNKKSS